MTCAAVVALTIDEVAGSLLPDVRAALELHRDACPGCAAYLASYLVTVTLAKSAYRDSDEEPLPESAVATILAARRKKA